MIEAVEEQSIALAQLLLIEDEQKLITLIAMDDHTLGHNSLFYYLA
ncbi:TPA: hypothetical protein ACSRWF_003550 [Morganella morganii]